MSLEECSAGTFGAGCQLRCGCRNNGTCDRVTGACQCGSGYYGHLCEHACPPGLHGPLCQLQCDCMNGASCHPATGQCVCPPGYHGARCHRECEQGTYGQGCSRVCDCEEDAPCDPATGRCLCPSGKTGARCDIGTILPTAFIMRLSTLSSGGTQQVTISCNCKANQYGPDCTETCQCDNGAHCNHRNGRCTCLNSWIGVTCQEGNNRWTATPPREKQQRRHTGGECVIAAPVIENKETRRAIITRRGTRLWVGRPGRLVDCRVGSRGLGTRQGGSRAKRPHGLNFKTRYEEPSYYTLAVRRTTEGTAEPGPVEIIEKVQPI
ncbi:Multiple epidermal growth factor-like domains protein 6 [Merluccius polli]|uniref:Multiple epidermal growth factor-like domains protein 6 n=1 Tax=Merluccius polli TaxID=89951 RepID=A0AA47NQH9_MERPO|nr:Multiple epidermal growth factor-like domains protein 6 [Merluccius polli]